MLQGRSFKNILNEKLQADQMRDTQSSVRIDNSPEHLAFLIGKMAKMEFPNINTVDPRAQKAYAKKPAPPRPAHAFNDQQAEAFLFLSRWANGLADNFNAQELKQAFRRAAIKLHPDHGGEVALFLKLRRAMEALTPLT